MRTWLALLVAAWASVRYVVYPSFVCVAALHKELNELHDVAPYSSGAAFATSGWQKSQQRRAGDRLRRRAAKAPRELVDLFDMKADELKAFLEGKGVNVDGCGDLNALIDRASDTESQWVDARPAPPPPAPARPAPSPRPLNLGLGSKNIEKEKSRPPPSAEPQPPPPPPPPPPLVVDGIVDAEVIRPPAPRPAPAPAPIPSGPSAADVEEAWKRLCEAWPGNDPTEFGDADANMTVILIHGFGDTGASFLQETFEPLTNIDGLRLLLPQAPMETLEGNALQSWFLPTNGQWLVDDTVVKPSVQYIHAMVRREIARGVPPGKIVLGGFAQGGSCAARAALSFPDAPLGGVVLLSTFFGSPAADIAPANKGLKVLVCHGKEDDLVPFSEGERAATVLGSLLSEIDNVEFKTYDMKHGVATDEVADVFEFIEARMAANPTSPPASEKPDLGFDPLGMSSSESTPAPAEPWEASPEPEEGVPELDPAVLMELMSDDEIVEAVKDPECMAVLQDIIMDPSTLASHKSNPRVAVIVDKLDKAMNRPRVSPAVD